MTQDCVFEDSHTDCTWTCWQTSLPKSLLLQIYGERRARHFSVAVHTGRPRRATLSRYSFCEM